MLSDLLFFLIVLISFILLVKAFFWKNQHFIKGLYVDQAVYLVCVYIFIVLLEVVPYLILLRNQNLASIYALVCATMDFFLLLIFVSQITTCVYLEDTVLVYKNLFVKKKIDLKGKNVIIKEKTDKKIVISKHCKITIDIRSLSGDINYLYYQIKSIINHDI